MCYSYLLVSEGEGEMNQVLVLDGSPSRRTKTRPPLHGVNSGYALYKMYIRSAIKVILYAVKCQSNLKVVSNHDKV